MPVGFHSASLVSVQISVYQPDFLRTSAPFLMTKILRQRLLIQYGECGKTQVLKVRKLQNRHVKPENYEKKTSGID